VVIARCEACVGSDRRGAADAPVARSAQRDTSQHDGSASRSRLDRDEVLRLYDAGLPITQIARSAGVSRQRIHAIAKSAGRTLRRVVLAEARSREAAEILT
jgi:hypothetical protein